MWIYEYANLEASTYPTTGKWDSSALSPPTLLRYTMASSNIGVIQPYMLEAESDSQEEEAKLQGFMQVEAPGW